MSEPVSGTQNEAASPSLLPAQRRAKIFAVIALWSPFIAISFTLAVWATLVGEPEVTAFRTANLVIAAGGFLAALGLLSGGLALRTGRMVGCSGLRRRAIFGLTANSLLICLAIVGVGTFVRLGRDLEKQNSKKFMHRRPSSEAASAHLAHLQKTLERLATNQPGDAGLVAAASSEYLRQLRAIGDDYAAKTKLINSQLASRIEEVTSKEALQSKERIALDYVEANDRFAAFAQNRNYYYRQALVNAGVSTNATAAALNAFESGRSTQKPWEANRRLGQSHLATLQFLDTNWGKWAFTNEQIEFETDSLKADYQKLQARVMDAYREVTNWPNKAKP